MRRLVLILTMLLGLGSAISPPVAAEDAPDIERIGGRVLATEPDALLAALATPMGNDALPAGFSNAAITDPADGKDDQLVASSNEFEHALGTVAYALDYAATGHGAGSAAATPSPAPGRLPDVAVGYAAVTYVVLDDDRAAEEIDALKAKLEGDIRTMGTPTPGATVDAAVESITVGDTDALLLSYVTTDRGIEAVIQIVVIPVGNVLTVGTALFAAADVDEDAVRADAGDLALAAVAYLGSVAESVP